MSEFARAFSEYVAAISSVMGVALIAALILLALSRVTFPTLRHLWHRASPLGRLFGALLFFVCSINATTKAPSRTVLKRVAASAASQVVYSSDKADRVLTVDDFARGFVQTRVGTDEDFDLRLLQMLQYAAIGSHSALRKTGSIFRFLIGRFLSEQTTHRDFVFILTVKSTFGAYDGLSDYDELFVYEIDPLNLHPLARPFVMDLPLN